MAADGRPVHTPKARAGTAARREAVLEAAMSVFGARGYNKAALTEVAERAGMTHAGVLHHFGSKERLLIAVLQYRDGDEVDGIAAREQVDGPAFVGHILDTIQANTERRGVVQTYAVLSAESVTDGHPAQEYFRGRTAALREKLVGVLREFAHDGVGGDELVRAANALIAVMDGLQVQWLLDPDAVDMPGTVAMVMDEVIDRLSSGTAAPNARSRADEMLSPR
jgi:AcrR family transcriptional regulator